MSPEELNALRRSGLSEHGEKVTRQSALVEFKMEKMYGFKDEKTNRLVNLGKEQMENSIAERILRDSKDEVLNYCPNCNKLARTPRAKQCRYCGHNWR